MAPRISLHPEINRTELAATIGIDRAYLTNIVNGSRKAPLSIAIAIFKETGLQLGPLAGKTKRDISTLERAQQITSAA